MWVRILRADAIGARHFEPGVQQVPDAVAGLLIGAGSAEPAAAKQEVFNARVGHLHSALADLPGGSRLAVKLPPRGRIA